MTTYCFGLVITILILQLLPQYTSSTSALFQTLSTECRTVITELSPCADYIRDEAIFPEEDCCSGVHSVAGIAKNRSGVTVIICECLKQGLDGTSYDPSKLEQLPKECGVDIDLPPVNSNIDCTH